MSVKEDMAERISKCGYGMLTAFEMAHNIFAEFKASGKQRMVYGIRDENGKCLDAFELSNVKVKA